MTTITATSDVERVKAEVAEAVTRALQEAGDAIQDDIVTGMFASGGGRLYRRPSGGTYYTHEASQPGHPPAVDTQALVRSADVEIVSPTEVEVGLRDEKAPLLEFGTEHIEPRPSLGPAVAREGKRFEQRLSKRLRGVQ